VAAGCPSLTSLNVSHTGGKVTDDGIKAIAVKCTSLTALDVFETGGKITGDAMKAVAAGCPSLTSLKGLKSLEGLTVLTDL